MHTIFTVDVEGHVGSDPVKHLIYGKTDDGRLCGIDMLMDILDRYDMRGVFFVDVAEAWDYGEERIAAVLKHIEERGHDVGVHIHPDHMADKKRLFLSEYSKDDQYAILSKCTDFYKKVLGHEPISFRAGKYGANMETLDILSDLGYRVDFSEFYGQKWCHIDPPVAKVNVQKLKNGLIEIPVTSYVSLNVGIYSRYDKLDCGLTFSEFKTLINKLEENSNDIAVLFAHSFSFLDWRRTPDNPKFKSGLKKRLEKQLDYVKSNKSIKSINLQEAVEIYGKIDSRNFDADTFVTMKGIKPVYWFVGRAKTVIKSRLDIKFRDDYNKHGGSKIGD